MGNDWTRLVEEAKVLGGPNGLRSSYANSGRVEGAAAVALVVAGADVVWVAVNKLRERAVRAKVDQNIAGLPSDGVVEEVSALPDQ
jgi:hypothetical protein